MSLPIAPAPPVSPYLLLVERRDVPDAAAIDVAATELRGKAVVTLRWS